jgi:trehalose synthase-fused probable maltokinase
LCEGAGSEAFTSLLPDILRAKRWFGGKARRIKTVSMVESIAVSAGTATMLLLMVRVEYSDGTYETYQMPVTAAFGSEADRLREECPQAVIAPLTVRTDSGDEQGVLYDALWNPALSRRLLQAIGQGEQFQGTAGTVTVTPTKAFSELVAAGHPQDPVVMKAEQSNTSLSYGGQVILKFYRRVEEGINPDLEIGRHLTDVRFPYVPPIAGAIEYRRASGDPMTLALLQQFVRNDGNAWQYSLNAVDRFMFQIVGGPYREATPPGRECPLLDLARDEYAPVSRELMGPYLQSAECLGRRTAELHLALSQIEGDPAFTPEALTSEYRYGRYANMAAAADQTLALLKERVALLSSGGQAEARRLFNLKPALDRTFRAFRDLERPVSLIRCHGDYHLGQVLCTGSDFMIIDFEGEPARSLASRRRKHPAMLDVAGMVRSFHYVPFAFLGGKRAGLAAASQDIPRASLRWAQLWSDWASAAFLKAYLGIARAARFWPKEERDVRVLFDVFLVEKAIYELGYELNNRPDWVEIPLHGLADLLGMAGSEQA